MSDLKNPPILTDLETALRAVKVAQDANEVVAEVVRHAQGWIAWALQENKRLVQERDAAMAAVEMWQREVSGRDTDIDRLLEALGAIKNATDSRTSVLSIKVNDLALNGLKAYLKS